jgi:poly-gamma-glutamate synthesis protein (capsule biosynthesis protein)
MKKKQRRSKENTLRLLGVLFVIAVLFFIWQGYGFAQNPKKEAKLVFVGDIMLSRNIGSTIEKKGGSDYLFEKTKNSISSADIAFGNLETPVSTRGENQGSIYSFRSDPNALSGVRNAGFDVLSVANNHAFDWGPFAFEDTLSNLKKYDIVPVGGGNDFANAHTPKILSVGKLKIAYLGYSQFAWASISDETAEPALNGIDVIQMKKDIEKAHEMGADLIVVSIHWGDEYEVHVNEYQKYIAHTLIDSGAHLIIGHHPHVVEEVEKYHGGLIAYSLGNFIFDQNFSPETRTGLMLTVSIEGGKIVSHEETPISFGSQFVPFVSGK